MNTANEEKASTLTPTSANSPVSSTASASLPSGAHSLATLTGMRNHPSIPRLHKTLMKRLRLDKERRPEPGRLSAPGFLLHRRVIGYPTTSLTQTVSLDFGPSRHDHSHGQIQGLLIQKHDHSKSLKSKDQSSKHPS